MDSNWHMGSGATNHITANLNDLTIKDNYRGKEKLTVGNGQNLDIKHVGSPSFTLHTNSQPLHLKNILHVLHHQEPIELGHPSEFVLDLVLKDLHVPNANKLDFYTACQYYCVNGTTTEATIPREVSTYEQIPHNQHTESVPSTVRISSPASKPNVEHISSSTLSHPRSTSIHPMQTRSKSGIYKPKALNDPNCKFAIMDEYKAPMINKTWSLVPYSTGMNVDENKWVFRVKCKLDGTIQRYKASPMVKPSTIRVILALAVTKGWDIQQIDINNAFLNGDLQKVALMLLKSIKKFALKTLGSLNYFLGFEVHRGSSVLYLTQTKYIIDLLKKTGMNGAKSISTHKLFGNKLFLSLGDPFEDPSLYHSTIGALQYLTMTRPDISFAVNKLSCPILWCDNIGAGSLPSSPVFHTRTKHIQIDVHFIHEKVLAKELDVRYISTEDQIVDVLTKPLSEARVEQLLNKLTVALSPFSLRGVLELMKEKKRRRRKMRRSEIVRKQVAAPPPLKLNAPAQSLTAAVFSVSLTEKKNVSVEGETFNENRSDRLFVGSEKGPRPWPRTRVHFKPGAGDSSLDWAKT
uniref:Retrovirus-related Pol polyprotein from transposon TNT 1-94-like beta-barrel domain-containing protein n=1 Tax=Vitis vinifera TaxID=29760 RepID=A5C037_VITVI|nr:hypothetical protein VITISV_015760 [Vitis vinifera]